MTIIYDDQIKAEDVETTHNVLCSHPLHDGIRYTRLPIGTLLDFTSNKTRYTEIQSHLAKLELSRRQFVDNPNCDFEISVSQHSIDRLSTLHMHRYLNDMKGEGIVCWLKGQVIGCLEELGIQKVTQLDGTSILHNGMKFTFVQHSKLPGRLVLSTIM